MAAPAVKPIVAGGMVSKMSVVGAVLLNGVPVSPVIPLRVIVLVLPDGGTRIAPPAPAGTVTAVNPDASGLKT